MNNWYVLQDPKSGLYLNQEREYVAELDNAAVHSELSAHLHKAVDQRNPLTLVKVDLTINLAMPELEILCIHCKASMRLHNKVGNCPLFSHDMEGREMFNPNKTYTPQL